MAQHQMSKKRKFVADGVFKAELNELFMRELAEDGYAGVEIKKTPKSTEIVILATRTQHVLGEKGRRIRELTAFIQKRFGFQKDEVELFAEKVANRGLCAVAQCENLRYKLTGGLAVRRACYGVVRFVMESGAKGCEVIVSGKLRAQRAKAMKFGDGFMISSGNPTREYIDTAVRHVPMRQGMIVSRSRLCCPTTPRARLVLRLLSPMPSPSLRPRRRTSLMSPSPSPTLLPSPLLSLFRLPHKLVPCMWHA